jgi:hypothetical protein
MATRAPVFAAIRLARTPPDPAPTTNRSKSYLDDIVTAQRRISVQKQAVIPA